MGLWRSRAPGLVLIVETAVLASCQVETVDPRSRDATAPAPAKPAAAEDGPAERRAEKGYATVRDGVPLPLTSLLGHPPPDVQARLGEPTGKGMQRSTCVRFVPERVWFDCNYAWQRYHDATGRYAAIQVAYEDGVATEVAFEGIPGDGAFDPRVALEHVGLVLPKPPRQSEPALGVTLWSWFNSEARLLIDGKQYRVEVSSRGDWASSKVDVILNDPLTEEQKAKIRPTG